MALQRLPALLILLPVLASAQTGDSTQPGDLEEGVLAGQLQNPVSDLMNVAFFNDVDMGIGEADEYSVMLTVVPQLPVRILREWNVIVWPIMLLQSLPTEAAGERINGAGDTVLRLLLAPAGPRKGFFWGLGPALLVPTATKAEFGAGAFGLGGAGAVGFQGLPWTGGLIVHHLRSVSETAGRPEVQRSALLPYLSYTTPSGVSFNLDSETKVEWERPHGERWLVPLGLTAGHVGLIGQQQVSLQLGARYYLEAPTGGPTWGLRLLVSFLFPVRPKPPARD